jgi:hypothetical protein
MEINYDDFNHTFKGYIGNVKVCELNIFTENEDCDDEYYKEPRYWLNGIYTTEGYGKNGYATLLIQEAINVYGELYVSTATEYEHKQRGDDTARQLTDDGAILVNRLKAKGILKSEWFINPFL